MGVVIVPYSTCTWVPVHTAADKHAGTCSPICMLLDLCGLFPKFSHNYYSNPWSPHVSLTFWTDVGKSCTKYFDSNCAVACHNITPIHTVLLWAILSTDDRRDIIKLARLQRASMLCHIQELWPIVFNISPGFSPAPIVLIIDPGLLDGMHDSCTQRVTTSDCNVIVKLMI